MFVQMVAGFVGGDCPLRQETLRCSLGKHGLAQEEHATEENGKCVLLGLCIHMRNPPPPTHTIAHLGTVGLQLDARQHVEQCEIKALVCDGKQDNALSEHGELNEKLNQPTVVGYLAFLHTCIHTHLLLRGYHSSEQQSAICKLHALPTAWACKRGNVSAPGARRASFVTRALPVDCCR